MAKGFYNKSSSGDAGTAPGGGPVFDIPGPKKAAILMVALGSEASANIVKNLNEQEVEHLTAQIARLEGVTPEMREYVLQEFQNLSMAKEYVTNGGIEYAQEVLEASMGPRKAREILEKVTSTIRTTGFNMLDNVELNQLISFLQKEHPQTVALLLAHMKPEKAASTLSALSPEMQVEVATRIATMESISPDVLSQVEQQLALTMKSFFSGDTAEVGGVKSVAEMLNMVDRSAEKNILGTLERDDPELATEIKGLMFVFEDMLLLDDKSIQKVLKEVDSKELSLALKGANEQVQTKFLGNMSSRAAEIIKEEISFMGPKRLREVEEAQQKIVDIVRRLESENEIIISGRGGEDDVIV
ncbi:MAG TPA: flagellar motor switch protein FliG [Fibrobacteraceae bacterium]|nr:flagellar motor switch protein FliG [Fibrobacteraceae bacterium]